MLDGCYEKMPKPTKPKNEIVFNNGEFTTGNKIMQKALYNHPINLKNK